MSSKWNNFAAVFSVLTIVLHFALLLFGFSQALQNLPLIIAIIISGTPLLWQIILKALNKNLGADLLAAIALVASALTAQYVAAALIIFMLASGQILEEYAKRKASSVLEALAQRMPSNAHRRRGGKISNIKISDIIIGDEIVIYPHETCPVDGVVVEGNGTMDESYLTGEPFHISKTFGSMALSGAINGADLLIIRAEKLPQDSRYAKIMEVMADAENRRPKLIRLADQIGAVFAPLAMALALAAWYFSGDILRFIAVLTVATPCPLLIAIPITIISAISLAAKRSIIIKDPAVLERLPVCSTAIFDKTGTLTYGEPQLSKVFAAQGFSENEIIQKAASLEHYSRHPLATALVDAASKNNLDLLEANQVSERAGQGLHGVINEQEILITSRKKVLQQNPEMASTIVSTDSGLECVVMIDKKYAGTLQFHDAPRTDSHSFIGHLGPEHNFKKIILLSGDRASEVNYLAGLLGIKETFASQSPEQKLEFVRNETAAAPTLFMGDGINDAPALAAATVGIAFGQHNSITSEAAGAVIMENTLIKVDELIHISIKMRRIALQSAVGGMVLSLVGIYLAAMGYLSPAQGALAQEIIDVLAILNALRMTWDKEGFSDL